MPPNENIKGFDGIRGISAICVVLTHLHVWYALEAQKLVSKAMLPLLSGSTGVQAFFILSGFLITLLLIREKQTTGTVSISKFIIRRSLRIFPLYVLLCILTTAVAIDGQNGVSWASMRYLYFYVYNFVPLKDYSPLLGHAWSLAVEEHFYLIWPLLFSCMFAARLRLLKTLLVVFAVGALFFHLALIRQPFAQHYQIDRWSFIAGYAIALGCLAALLTETGAKNGFYRMTCRHRLSGLLGAGMYANSLFISTQSWAIENIILVYLRAVGILLMILWIYFNQSSIATRILDCRPLKYLGRISYGIYMWQGFFLSTGPNREPGQQWPPDPALGVFLLLVVAPLSYAYFEKPFLRLKHLYASAKAPASEPPLAKTG